MNIDLLVDAADDSLAQALHTFEQQFTYPLGDNASFHIEHGRDYARFYRPIGPGGVFIARKRSGEVLGTLAVALRDLQYPDGARQRVAYLGDLKVSPHGANGLVYLRLAQAACDWGRKHVDAAYGVVMRGTTQTPDRYSGRLGIPRFNRLHSLTILRVPTDHIEAESGSCDIHTYSNPCEIAHAESFLPLGGDAQLRSHMAVTWLQHSNASASGRFEDTSLAKRLFTNRGEEMKSAHLSQLSYTNPLAAADLIHFATLQARQAGLPAVFTCIPQHHAHDVLTHLASDHITQATADIYAFNIDGDAPWTVSTSEI